MTATRQALGRWPNAPLALVLAQVRFEPTTENSPQLLAERIKQRTGSSYPHSIPLQQISFFVGQGNQPSIPHMPETAGIDLRNSAYVEAIRLQLGALTFTTSDYQHSADFAVQWRSLMDALCGTSELRVLRLGMRYVDFIIPSAGHVPEDYFLDGLGRSPAALGEQSPIAFNLYDYARPDGGQLRVQFGRGFGPPGLPPDLQDTVLPPVRLSTKSDSSLSAVLDMDRWRPCNEDMSAETITNAIEDLRLDIASSFKSIMSQLAFSEWQNPPTERR